MMTFRKNLQDLKLPLSSVWLLNDIAEAKGRQKLYTKQSPQILKALREMAMVQSVESSNRIEGVTVAADRLQPLVLGNTRPRDRSEEEIQGYRDALQRIHTAAPQASSTGWHEGKHDLLPWLNYFLAVLRRAYVQFEERAGQVKSPKGAETALVTAAIQAAVGPFTLADLERTCPGVSRAMIRHILRHLQKEGRVECQGRGLAAVWRNKGNTS